MAVNEDELKKIEINTAYLIRLLLTPIPMSLLLLDNPTKFPGKLIEGITGVSERTIKNLTQGKHSISKKTANTISSKLSKYYIEIHGVEFDSKSFEDLLLSGHDSFLINSFPGSLIKDDFSKYYIKTIKLIQSVHHQLFNIYKDQCQSKADKACFRRLINHLLNSGLPDEMMENEYVNFKNLDDIGSNIAIINNFLNFFKFDLMFYELSAHDVEYCYFFERINGVKIIGIRYLPYENNKGIKNSTAIYFDRVMKQLKEKPEYKINSLNDLAERISENQSKEIDIDSIIRHIKRWKNGKTIPKWESMDKIFETLVKIQCEKDETLKAQIEASEDPIKEKYETEEYGKEQSREYFRYVIIFQRILNEFEDSGALSNQSIVSFFERYYYWHNYHTVNFYEARK